MDDAAAKNHLAVNAYNLVRTALTQLLKSEGRNQEGSSIHPFRLSPTATKSNYNHPRSKVMATLQATQPIMITISVALMNRQMLWISSVIQARAPSTTLWTS